MARKKHEEDAPDTGGWINTFADLMNLLLCFFVLLFSMSTVDADKYEQLVTSMTERINIFDAGGSAVGEGAFVSSGTDQLVSISQYFNEFEESGQDTSESNDQKTETPGDQKTDEDKSKGAQGQDSEKANASEEELKKKFEQEQQEDQKEKAEQLYGEVVSEAQKKNIEDQININMDKKYQYVQISMNGAILFDSGSASIKRNMTSLLSKVGDILKIYDKNMIKIEGHTDNVPISSGQYRSNMQLSSDRALAVFEFLVNRKKMNPATLESAGRGEYNPIASNKTANGRARNRRVEIKIYTDK